MSPETLDKKTFFKFFFLDKTDRNQFHMTKTEKSYTHHSNSKLILMVQYVRFLLADIQKLSTEHEAITVLTFL